jgi:hypothetical protein
MEEELNDDEIRELKVGVTAGKLTTLAITWALIETMKRHRILTVDDARFMHDSALIGMEEASREMATDALSRDAIDVARERIELILRLAFPPPPTDGA